MDEIIKCNALLPGRTAGTVLASNMALSFWGGVDTATGKVIDPRHEWFERCLTGKILVFPFAKGSAGAPAILLELIRCRTSPAAIVNIEAEPLLISGPILGRHLYGSELPLVTVDPESFGLLQTGQYARIDTAEAAIRLSPDS
jgi:hypothetical protein